MEQNRRELHIDGGSRVRYKTLLLKNDEEPISKKLALIKISGGSNGDTYMHEVFKYGEVSPSSLTALLDEYRSIESALRRQAGAPDCRKDSTAIEKVDAADDISQQGDNFMTSQRSSLVSIQNIAGATPLHVLCCSLTEMYSQEHREAGLDLVSLLLEYHTNILRPWFTESLSTIAMKGGTTPLHLLMHARPLSVMNQRVVWFKLQIGRVLLEDDPSTSIALDSDSNTPLHRLWLFSSSMAQSWCELHCQKYRFQQEETNRNSASGFSQYAFRSWLKNRYRDLRLFLLDQVSPYYSPRGTSSTAINPVDLEQSNRCAEMDESLRILAPTIASSSVNRGNASISAYDPLEGQMLSPFALCTLARHPRCPPTAVLTALEMMPSALVQHQLCNKDPMGRIPLHYAACATEWFHPDELWFVLGQNCGLVEMPPKIPQAGESASFVSTSRSVFDLLSDEDTRPCGVHLGSAQKEEFVRYKKDTVLDLLVAKSPATAAISDDQTGCLPLHLALIHQKYWDGGIHALVDAYAPALYVADPKTGLYPFLLAARGDHSEQPTIKRRSSRKTTEGESSASEADLCEDRMESNPSAKPLSKCSVAHTNDDADSLLQLATIFRLLKCSPDLMNHLIKSMGKLCPGDSRKRASMSTKTVDTKQGHQGGLKRGRIIKNAMSKELHEEEKYAVTKNNSKKPRL
eukprot:scaffold64187_cov57-Attheya_sp.AAC.4